MRRLVLVALALVAALATGRSRAQEAPAKGGVAMVATTNLPFHPYGRANVGDWSVSVFRATRPGELLRVHGGYDKVVAVDGKKVTVATGWFDTDGRGDERVKVFSTDELSVKKCFQGDAVGDELSDAKIAAKETTEVVAGQKWKGYALSFHYSACKQSWDQTLFLCADVPGGLVLARIQEYALGKLGDTVEGKIAGYGTAEKVVFGRSIEDVKKDLAKR